MTIDEIFSALANHMINGMMVHEQLMNSYLFLGLKGYAKCHEYHYISETKGYIRLTTYKVEQFHSLIRQERFEIPNIIPDSWFGFTRYDVGEATRQQAIQAAIDEWIEWESETKELYEKAYKDLMDLGFVATAEFIKGYILDVEEELVYARNDKLCKASMGFDMASIIEEQNKLVKFFEKKIRKS